MCRLPAISVTNAAEFDVALSRLCGPATDGGLRVGQAVRVDFVGPFLADPMASGDINWAEVEEAQMRARLDSLPDEYWATLRGSGEGDTLYFDVARLDL